MLKRLFAKKSIDSLVAEAGERIGGLKKTLTAFHLTALGIGAIIGAGVFVLTGQVAADYAGPGLVLSFVFAALICLFAALCYAEFAAMIPVAGGVYSYAYATLGELAAWIIGWGITMEYMLASSTIAVGWSGYFASLMGDFGLHIPAIFNGSPLLYDPVTGWATSGSLCNLPAMILVGLMGWLIARGVKGAASVNNILVVVKLSVIALFIGIGVAYINPANWHPFIPENTGVFGQYGWSGILRGAGVVFFAFIGFDAISTLAQEAKNPQRDLPLGMIGSLGISTLAYIAVALVLTGLVSFKLLGVPDPIAVAVNTLGSGYLWLRFVIKVAILAGLTSGVMVMLMCQTRVFYGMAQDGLLPPRFAKVHPKLGVPRFNTAIVALATLTFAGFFPVGILAPLVSMGTLLAFAFVCFAVLLLRRTRPDLKRPFRTPWVPVVPILGMLICLAQMAFLPGVTWWQTGVWMLVGALIYFFYGMGHSKVASR